MRDVKRRAVLRAAAAIAIVLAIAGCFHRPFSQFQYERTAETERSLYDPIQSGQAALIQALRTVPYEPVVFSLDMEGGKRLETSPTQEMLLDETKAVFFQVPGDAPDSLSKLFYFNPRTLRFHLLSRLLTAGGETGNSFFSLFRSIPDNPALTPWSYSREICRYDFQRGKDGIVLRGMERLTTGKGTNSMPEIAAFAKRIVYLHEESKDKRRLMSVGWDGRRPEPVFERQSFDVLFPKALTDGRIVFSANPEGYYQLYQIPPPHPMTIETEAAVVASMAARPAEPMLSIYEPFKAPFPPGEPPCRLMLANAPSGAHPVALALVELPDKLSLAAICALVEARNLSVNRHRALLAAALIEAGQARLANWPSIDLGIYYTPKTGVFLDKPIVSSGDFLAEHMSRGIVGLVQPLLDYPRNAAYQQSLQWRAEWAYDKALNEINERIAEAAELYFEAQYNRRIIRVLCQQYEVMSSRLRYYQMLRTRSESLLSQLLATEQILEGQQSEIEFHARRLEFLKSRLKEVCGLPEGAACDLEDERFLLREYEPEPLEKMRHTALLHHPSLKAANAALARAFYQENSGPDRRPSADLGAEYGQTRRDFGKPIDDYITVALRGRMPLAWFSEQNLHQQFWDQMFAALRFEREAQARTVATAMEEALLDFRAAQRDCDAKRSSLLFRQEELRLARAYNVYGHPDPTAHPGLVSEVAARTDQLDALGKLHKVEMDLGLRYAKLWREMGLSSRLGEEIYRWSATARAIQKPSLWLWNTKQILASDEAMRAFMRFAKKHHIQRVYAYLGAGGSFLTPGPEAEKIAIFLNFCDEAGVEVWGLIKEQEWAPADDGEAPITSAIIRIQEFNRARGPLESRIAGVKLELKSHEIEGRISSSDERKALAQACLGWLRTARALLNGSLPLWVDIPVQFFRPENAELMADLTDLVDGVSLMCFFNSQTAIAQHAVEILDRFPKPLEIGVSLSQHQPDSSRMPAGTPAEFDAFCDRLRSQCASHGSFAGIAWHDYEGATHYFGQDSSGRKKE
ncbi:MAG: TolC family protein [Candidatus Sumerlaeota bacterium]|nr:TolC family protein [Candidatus Sumerlaeota bacterium]